MEEFVIGSLDQYLAVSVILVCFIIGYVVKNYTPIKNGMIPLVVIISGMIVNIIIAISHNVGINVDIIIQGAVSGMASSGLYELLKKTFGVSDSK